MAEWSKGDVPEGWHDLVSKTDEKMMFLDPEYKITQVKEKFGQLRFYYASMAEELIRDIMSDVSHAVEMRSAHICETCGKYGELRNLGWMRTLCDEHYEGVYK